MSSGTTILLAVLASVVFIVTITLTGFRYATRSVRLRELVQEGVLLTEKGLEFPRSFLIGTLKVNYADVESVELIPFYKALVSILCFRYGVSVRSACTRLFHEIVVVKLKGPRLIKYQLLTPKDPAAFVEKLNSRIEQCGISRSGS